MKTVFKDRILVLVPETAEEAAALGAWKAGRAGHVLDLCGIQVGMDRQRRKLAIR